MTFKAEQVESAVVRTTESAALAAPQITAEENQKLTEVRVNNAASLKNSGILPELAITNDIELVQKNFKALDKSGDGHVTKNEIDEFIKNSKELKPEDAAAMKRVGEQISKLSELSDDKGRNDRLGGAKADNGITNNDLKIANQNSKAMDYAQRNFDRLDGNGDGHVSTDELDAYAKARGDKLSAEERANIDTLKKNMSDLEEYSNDETGDENDGFTRHDLIDGRKEQGTDTLKTGGEGGDQGNSSGDLRPALDYAQKNFDAMDADHDGHISADEIDQYMDKNKDKLTGEEAQNLRALKAKVGEIEELSNDELLDEDNGISKKDIAMAKEQVDTLAYAQKNFDKLDGNGDGHVTGDEIEGYIKAQGNDISADELRKLETLKKQVDDLEEKHNDELGDEDSGFTRHDLVDALDELGSASARDGKPSGQKPGVCTEQPAPEGRQRPGQNTEPGRQGDKTPVGDHEYTIKPGDSFWKISKENLRAQTGKEPTNAEILKATKELAAANGGDINRLLLPGMTLRVPGPEKSSAPRNAETEPVQNVPGRRPAPERGRTPEPVMPETRQPNPRTEEPPQNNQQEKVKESATQVLQRRFSEIDKNGNNKVNRKEIESYLNEHSKDLTSEEIKALDQLARNASKIESMVDDEKGPENDGMSRKDLDKLQQVQKASADMLNNGMFKDLDSDRNNFLSKEEITKALTTKRLTREERLTLEFLKDNLKILQKGTDDEKGREDNGVSNADMRYYASMV